MTRSRSWLERAEEPVPDDEHTSVVTVHVLRVVPWCTRWCDGVLNTYSKGPSRSIVSVWIQNW